MLYAAPAIIATTNDVARAICAMAQIGDRARDLFAEFAPPDTVTVVVSFMIFGFVAFEFIFITCVCRLLCLYNLDCICISQTQEIHRWTIALWLCVCVCSGHARMLTKCGWLCMCEGIRLFCVSRRMMCLDVGVLNLWSLDIMRSDLANARVRLNTLFSDFCFFVVLYVCIYIEYL